MSAPTDDLTALRAENARLRADAARLDWVEEHCQSVRMTGPGDYSCGAGRTTYGGLQLRALIDMARRSTMPAVPTPAGIPCAGIAPDAPWAPKKPQPRTTEAL